MNAKATALFIAVAVSAAAAAASDRGRASGVFLRLNRTAREAALGGAGTGAGGPAALGRNPAAVGEGAGALFSRNESAGGLLNVDTAALAGRWRGKAIGVSMVHASGGGIDQTDDVGESVGSFTPRDVATTVGGAARWGAFSAGATVSYLYSKIIHAAHAVTAGLGAEWRSPGGDTRAGFYGTNLGGRLAYVDDAAPLPRSWRLGVHRKISAVGLVLEGVAPNDDDPYASGGVELGLGRGAWSFALRGGFDGARGRSQSGAGGFTGGAGIGAAGWRLDYAFVPGGDVGDDHIVTFGLRFKPSASSAPRETIPPRGT